MIANTILTANRAGRKALVFALTYKDLWAVEAAAQAGFDAVSLDGEHGAFAASDVDDRVRVANGYGMSVMARVPNIQPSTLNLWLDRAYGKKIETHLFTGHYTSAFVSSEGIALPQKMQLRKPLVGIPSTQGKLGIIEQMPNLRPIQPQTNDRKHRERDEDFNPTRKQPPSCRHLARIQPGDHIEGKAAHTQQPGPIMRCIRVRPQHITLLLLRALSD
jgi:hypothetical protein